MPDADLRTRQDILCQCDFFSGLSPSAISVLSQCLTEKKFSAGQEIFMKGDVSDCMYFIVQGSVDISMLLENGKKINLNRLGPNEFFGEIGLLDRNIRTSNATALTDIRLLKLSRSDFDNAAIHFNVEEWFSIVSRLCALLRKINDNLETLALADPNIRLAKKLLALPQIKDGDAVAVYVSQSELAEMVNLTRETTNKFLSQMEKQGYIKTNYGKIIILKPQNLLEYLREANNEN